VDGWWTWIRTGLELEAEVYTDLALSATIILGLWLLRLLIVALAERRIKGLRARYRWRKLATYVVVLAGLFLVGRVWLEGIQPLATFLGLISAGLAVALRDPLTNLAGWLFILWRRPFEVGDRIQIGDLSGDAVDVRIFEFTLLEIGNWVAADQSTGRVVHVPNGKVFRELLINYTTGLDYIWNEIPVHLTFESDWMRAKELLAEIATRHAARPTPAEEAQIRHATGRFMITYSALTPAVYTSVVENGVRLTIRYLCRPRRRRATEQAIWEDVLRAFAPSPTIEFAYPTQRFYRREREGPQSIGPDPLRSAPAQEGDSHDSPR
jgi:small-conductance mechanosensitive channel